MTAGGQGEDSTDESLQRVASGNNETDSGVPGPNVAQATGSRTELVDAKADGNTELLDK